MAPIAESGRGRFGQVFNTSHRCSPRPLCVRQRDSPGQHQIPHGLEHLLPGGGLATCAIARVSPPAAHSPVVVLAAPGSRVGA